MKSLLKGFASVLTHSQRRSGCRFGVETHYDKQYGNSSPRRLRTRIQRRGGTIHDPMVIMNAPGGACDSLSHARERFLVRARTKGN